MHACLRTGSVCRRWFPSSTRGSWGGDTGPEAWQQRSPAEPAHQHPIFKTFIYFVWGMVCIGAMLQTWCLRAPVGVGSVLLLWVSRLAQVTRLGSWSLHSPIHLPRPLITFWMCLSPVLRWIWEERDLLRSTRRIINWFQVTEWKSLFLDFIE